MFRTGTFFILGMFITIATHATNTQPDSSCESILSPPAQIVEKLTSRKKTLTIITGETKSIESLMKFSLAQLEGEFSRYTTFEISDHVIEDKEFRGQDDSEVQLKDNLASFILPLEERMGKTQVTAGLLLRDWLNQDFDEPTIKQLLISASQLSIKQQKELLEIYNSLPDDLDFHLMLFSTHAENWIPAFREKTNVIHADNTGMEDFVQSRKEHLRFMVKHLLEAKQKISLQSIETESMKRGQSFTTDMITLAQTLTHQDVEFFLMQTEAFRQEQQSERPAFEDMIGIVGSIQVGTREDDKATLSTWNDVVSSGPNKKNIRMIVIPKGNLTESELHSMKKWVDQISEGKDAHLYRILFLEKI